MFLSFIEFLPNITWLCHLASKEPVQEGRSCVLQTPPLQGRLKRRPWYQISKKGMLLQSNNTCHWLHHMHWYTIARGFGQLESNEQGDGFYLRALRPPHLSMKNSPAFKSSHLLLWWWSRIKNYWIGWYLSAVKKIVLNNRFLVSYDYTRHHTFRTGTLQYLLWYYVKLLLCSFLRIPVWFPFCCPISVESLCVTARCDT